MALDLETLDAALDRLRLARVTGVSRVVIDGVETSFKTDDEMASAEAWLSQRIAALTGATVTTIRVSATKGLDT
jgi:hypothetical protein